MFVGALGLTGILMWFLTLPLLLVMDGLSALREAREKSLERDVNALKGGQIRGSFGLRTAQCHFPSIAKFPRRNGCKDSVEESRRSNDLPVAEAALTLRTSKSPRHRAYCMAVLAIFKPSGAWDAIAPFIDSPDRKERLRAARWLLEIDISKGLLVVFEKYAIRRAFSKDALGEILSEIVPARIEGPFLEALLKTPTALQVRLVDVLPYLGEWGKLMPLRTFQPLVDRNAWIISALRLVDSSRMMPLIRPYLRHPDPIVRFYVVRALERYGEVVDIQLLKPMLYLEVAPLRRAAALGCVSLITRQVLTGK